MPSRPEQLPSQEIWAELAERFANTFITRHDTYPIQQANGSFLTVKQPLTLELIVAHLQGAITLGAYALDIESMAHWICFDADTDEHWDGLKQLATLLQTIAATPYLELSRRGGHLWLFTPPLPGLEARRFGHELLREHQLEGIELYPRQDRLITGPGSLVRLPFGVHRKAHHIYHFIAPDGQPLAPTIRDQIHLLAAPAIVSQAFIERVLMRAPAAATIEQSAPYEPNRDVSKMSLSERLKATISVLSFVSRYVALDERHAGFCPFHDDQVKSFSVNAEANYWHCFAGCGGGSIIDFWQRWRKTHSQDGSFTETVKELRIMLLTDRDIEHSTRRRRKRK